MFCSTVMSCSRVGDPDGDPKRSTGHLMSRIDAIRFINPPAMEDNTYQFVYRTKVPRKIRRPLMWLAAYQAKYASNAPAENLNFLVQAANNCVRPTARKHIKRAVDLDLISEVKEGREVHYHLTIEQVARARRVLDIIGAISRVVKAQCDSPYNATAGSDLVSNEVYYNIIGVADFYYEDAEPRALEPPQIVPDLSGHDRL